MSMAPIEGASVADLSGAGAWEWLEADGLGGWAMGTVAGPRTRRYHGLLCVATRPPTGRVMLVHGLGETFFDGHTARALDAHFYPGVVFPDGHTALERFALDPWPSFTYALDGGRLLREVIVLRGRPGVIVRWRWLPHTRHPGALATLTVRPLCSGRDTHALHHENATLDARCKLGEGLVELTPYPGAIPGVRLQHGGSFRVAPDWYRRFVYPLERERGLDCEEDLFCPGELSFDLSSAPAYLCMTPQTEPALALSDVPSLIEAEAKRRSARKSWAPAPVPDDPSVTQLVAAAESFVVTAVDRARGDTPPHATVIAGYPWFTDWGRDTFISARGLGLAFGPTLERDLLSAWEPFVSAGMIPNRFPEGARGLDGAEYNAVDASLWYALRCARHLLSTATTALGGPADAQARKRLAGAVHRILDGYLGGTRHGIHVDDDGLVHAADPGVQLTWMDAKVGDWVVTPRSGKPVEVQALWVGALEAAARLFASDEPKLGNELAERAAWARSSFAARFWCEARGYLYDVIDGPIRDETLRPNQLYALGLVRPMVDPDRARRALEAVERELLVPVGLRSRARGNGYRGRMTGTPLERDGAYHEGTVWAFLLGIYADACQRVRGRVPPGVLRGLFAHLEGPGLGQIAEVFDGDSPHHPRGCPAQAWSVAEALRVRLGAVAED